MSKKNKLPRTTEAENRLGNNTIIFASVFALIVSFLLVGCGARKVNKTETEKTEKTEQTSVSEEKSVTESNVKTEVVTVENSNDSTITETVEIRPIDNTKPAYFDNNGKIESISNAYFYKTRTIKKSKTQKAHNEVSESKLNKTDEKALKTESKVLLKEKAVAKQTERESLFSWWWLLLIIPVGIAIRKWINNAWWV